MDLEGKSAIVTGSSSGIGAAIAVELSERGCSIAVNYSRNRKGAEEVAARCREKGAQAITVQADVSRDADCQKLVDAAAENFGSLEILVNNAGTTKFCRHQDLSGLDKQDFMDIYEVNLVGPFQMTRAAEAALRQAETAHIVNMGSIAALTGVGSSVAYAASKGALVTMTLSLARVLGPQIRVNAVCPGFVAGEWLKKGLGEEAYETIKNQYEQAAPLNKTATPETVAQTVAALVGGADLTTGETLIIDGGMHLHTAPLGR
ncbi:MAG: SDR family NAD(P)-dependent oxidoreductase [Desulfobacterales bacterium]